jgi:hypothetical protein
MLAPLSVGTHTIILHLVPDPAYGSEQSVVYHLTVKHWRKDIPARGSPSDVAWFRLPLQVLRLLPISRPKTNLMQGALTIQGRRWGGQPQGDEIGDREI